MSLTGQILRRAAPQPEPSSSTRSPSLKGIQFSRDSRIGDRWYRTGQVVSRVMISGKSFSGCSVTIFSSRFSVSSPSLYRSSSVYQRVSSVTCPIFSLMRFVFLHADVVVGDL